MRNFTPLTGYGFLIMAAFAILQVQDVRAQVVKIDLNFDGRQESEVHAPGYSSWVISADQSDSFTESSITFEFVADGFSSGWYKAGIQSPYFARLASDALISQDVTLHITGLPAGEHSLLSFHNTLGNPENNTYSNIRIYEGETLVVDDLEQSNRVTSDSDAATAFITFEVEAGETAVLRFKTMPESTASDKSVYLNGFELNTGDAARQPSHPYPADRDEHANADAGAIQLKWKAVENALSHNLYVGNGAEEVLNADQSSPLFRGNLTDTSYTLPIDDWSTYYWRVDEVYADDVVKGNVWYFRPRHLAFPEAEGYGRHAIGGRGGQVVYVTNLNDDGPGSLREAVTNDIGPRTIVFDVSGLITLESRLVLRDDYVTVAGQTAPGKGICIKGAPFGMSGASDCMIQNIRVRIGDGPTFDGMGMQGSNHCIIDHCSISWTLDESFSSRSGLNITLQRTLISEPLNIAGHSNYPEGTSHGYAASISGDIGSFHHNLLAHSYGRNWSLAGGLDGNGIYAGRLDISNNVVYNFGKRTTDGGAHEVNFINNYYKPGSGHQGNNYALNAQYDNFPGTQRYYFAGNVMPGHFDESNQEAGRRYSGNPQGYSPWVDEPFFPSEITMHTASEAYKSVLSDVGCVSPAFDAHDQRIIEETLTGTYTYKGSQSGIPGMPDSHEDVGGWETYPEMQRAESWDTDRDGLPDWWEAVYGLGATSGAASLSEANADPDGDGYTHLEEYLEWMDRPHYFLPADTALEIDLGQYTRGYELDPVYEILEVSNGHIEPLESGNEIRFTTDTNGLSAFTFKVTDGEGDSRIITVGLVVGQHIAPDEEEEEEEETVLDMDRPTTTRIYPNPVSDVLKIESYERIIEVSLINILGQEVHARKNNLQTSSTELDLSRLPKGMYLLKIFGETHQESIKIIK